tara:strand:+ start:166 stop:513 length:348 start_codon:yes stop_codon:yes gene_type:complete
MPQEIEVWYVLPAVRCELSKQMIDLGLSQAEIAEKLGITRAAVSQYVKLKRAKAIIFDDDMKKKIKLAAKRIVEDNSSIMKEIQQVCDFIKDEKKICFYHHEIENLPKDCKVCFE